LGANTFPPGQTADDVVNPPRPALAEGRVRHVGEPIALVVAETAGAAADAADAIAADIDPLPAVVEPQAALSPDAPRIWDDAPGNLSFVWQAGDAAAVERALEAADRVVRIRVRQQRIAGTPLEPRAVVAVWDAEAERYILHAGSQGAPALRGALAGQVLKVPADRLRVVTGDVGGAFGLKTPPYPEYAPLLLAARRLGRPVKWVSSRGEALLADNQAREGVAEAALALDSEGRFLALKVEVAAALGAYLSASAAVSPTKNFAGGLSGPYLIPAIAVTSRGVFTNTLPTGPYRGAGRPEATYLLERLVDLAGRETGLGPVDIRRRNLLPPERIPYNTPLDFYYDSGDFPAVLAAALERANWHGFEARREASLDEGLLRGIGLCAFVEVAGNVLNDTIDLRFTDSGRVEVRTCVQETGQSQRAVYGRLVARTLGLDEERIAIIEGDSDLVPPGGPSVASRTTMVAAAAMQSAARSAIARGRGLAAERLEAAEADVEFAEGVYRVAGTDRRLSLMELAADPEAREALSGVEKFEAANSTFPNGCHVAEVEIDRDTGHVDVVRYTAIDDCGTVLDEHVVEGQVMGGVAQGLGQALMEEVVYDSDGQILSGSLMDYALPRAEEVPDFRLGFVSTISPSTPLGAKGAGEAGTTASLAAIINAINDALAREGAQPMDMPARAEAVWRALNTADGG
ncbi:MAG TPA: molybdopterin cofactor-binding domain-containing protein, partial [Afifellaceae bacterium]|nr:molybdopterin cofactor-binding domain-containing protein [Afifellaceae bacterium]